MSSMVDLAVTPIKQADDGINLSVMPTKGIDKIINAYLNSLVIPSSHNGFDVDLAFRGTMKLHYDVDSGGFFSPDCIKASVRDIGMTTQFVLTDNDMINDAHHFEASCYSPYSFDAGSAPISSDVPAVRDIEGIYLSYEL